METDMPKEQGGGGKKTFLIVGLVLAVVLVAVGVFLAVYFTVIADDDDSSSAAAGTMGGADGTVNLAVSAPNALNNLDTASLITSRESAKSARNRKATNNKAIDVNAFAAHSDYNTDVVSSHVDDPIQDPIDTINNIVCMISQAQFGSFMPTDPSLPEADRTFCYIAQVDENLCGDDEGDDENGSGSVPDIKTWTVCATNDVDAEEYVARVAIDNGNNEFIRARVSVSYADIEVNSDTNAENAKVPRYSVRWNVCDGLTETATCPSRGYMTIHSVADSDEFDVGVEYWQEFLWSDEQYPDLEQTLISAAFGRVDTVNDVGHGGVTSYSGLWDQENQQPYFVQQNIEFAFGGSYLSKSSTTEGSSDVSTGCLNRDDPLEFGERYNAYDSMGAHVSVNTGMSVVVEVEGVREYGYVSYWGVHSPVDGDGNEVFQDGLEVTIVDWNTETETTMTLREFSGQMYKIEKDTLTLSELKGLELHMYLGESYPDARAEFNPTENAFFLTKYRGEDNQFIVVNPPTRIVFNEQTAPWGWTWFYASALGGGAGFPVGEWFWNSTSYEVYIVYEQPTSETEVSFEAHSRVPVGATGVPTEMYCYENCYDASTLGTRGNNQYPRIDDEQWGFNLHGYTFDSTAYTVTDVQNNMGVTVATVQTSDNEYDHWYIDFEMYENTTANWEIIKCDGNSRACAGRSFRDLPVRYRWETGTPPWRKVWSVEDADGVVVNFDEPLRVQYTHSGTTSNSGTDYDGNKFSLEIHNGNICCLPYVCIDINQQTTDCDGEGVWRHVKDIFIPQGSLVTDTSSDPATEYVLKALDIVQVMQPTDASNCEGLTIPSVTMPTVDGWETAFDGFTFPTTGLQVLVESGDITIDCSTDTRCNDIGNLDDEE